MNGHWAALLLAGAACAHAQDTLKFSVAQYRVEGSSLLSDAQIQATLGPYTGPDRQFADVQRARQALEALYREAGFGSLQVLLPEQALTQGVVRFLVVEPRLGRVLIEGVQHFGEDNVRRALPTLREGEPLNTRALGANLRLANESPSRRMALSLQAGQSAQTLDARLEVADEKPWRVFASLDNSGTRETGRSRLAFGWQHANVLDRDQVVTAQLTTSPEQPDKVGIIGLGYKLPLYARGDSINVFAGYSSVESGALQGLFSVNGKGRIGGARYNQSLAGEGAYQHKLAWGLDWRRFDSNTEFAGGGSLGGSRYTLLPASLAYQAQWQGPQWSFEGSATLSANLRGGADLAQAAGRAQARQHYRIARLDGHVYFRPQAGWTAHLALFGQYSADALPPGEQFGLGGVGSVRGYGERVQVDDKGLGLNLEAYAPDVAARLGWAGWSLRGLAFYDAGQLRRNLALPGERPRSTLAGAGLGLRLAWRQSVSLRLDMARALREGGGERKGDHRVHAALIASY